MARYRIGRIIVEIGDFSRSGQFGYPCGSSFISDRNKCFRDPKTGSRLKKPITRSIYDRIVKSKGKAAQSLYRDREAAIRNKRSEGAKGWKKSTDLNILLPELQGSPKQIAWAADIRKGLIDRVKEHEVLMNEKIESLKAKGRNDAAAKRIKDLDLSKRHLRVALNVKESGFWIKNKDNINTAKYQSPAEQIRFNAIAYKYSDGFNSDAKLDDPLSKQLGIDSKIVHD